MNDRLEDLCNRMLDGGLDAEGEQELHDLVLGDRSARQRLLQYTAMQAVLRRQYSSLAAQGAMARPVPTPRRWWTMLAAGLAALIAVVLLVGRQSAAPEPHILTVGEIVGGDLIWSTDATTRRILVVGDTIPAGHLMCEGEGANASVRFADGTRLTLDGGTELSIDEHGQKQLHLTRGLFSAEVEPQPAGRPMIIRTATAELQVLGTVFSVAAQPSATALDVASGTVRLQRLADGRTVTVAGRQQAVATLDVSARLDADLRQRPPTTLVRRFDQAPPEWCRGTWQPGDEAHDGVVRAAPLTVGRKRTGEPVIVHGMTVRSAVSRTTPMVQVGSDSRLRLRFRTATTAPDTTLVVFFSTVTAAGDYGGNFETRIDLADAPADAAGWHLAEIPLSRCRPLNRERHPRFVDRDVVLIMPHVFTADVGLVIDEVAILP